jgi:hypothetical protein
MPNTRSAARPDHQQRLKNAALRNRVKKGYEKAQQEEAFVVKYLMVQSTSCLKNIKVMVLMPYHGKIFIIGLISIKKSI